MVCVCVHACVWVHTYLKIGVHLLVLCLESHLPSCSGRRSGLLIRLHWVARGCQASILCLCHFGTRDRSTFIKPRFFLCWAGDWTQFLMLAREVLYSLNHLLSPLPSPLPSPLLHLYMASFCCNSFVSPYICKPHTSSKDDNHGD